MNASEAMIKASECWRNYERHMDKVTTGIGNGTFADNCHFGKAIGFGNIDGLCGKALFYHQSNDENKEKKSIEFHKLAAYCGHSYAMYCVTKYYDRFDIDTANKCYLKAAEWGYAEAKNECARRNIK